MNRYAYDQFEYENELSIDPNLICSICLNPLNQPQKTPCEHLFCSSCIHSWLKKSYFCPLCREFIPKRSLECANNLMMLDELTVKCLLCEQTNIKRTYFHQHIEKDCLKMIISCSKCSWTGYRHDFVEHRMICTKKFHDKHSIKMKFHRLKIETLSYRNRSSRKISLRNRQITDNDIPIVIKSTIRNRQCQILDLGCNQFDSDGVLKLAESLEHNQTLELLSLQRNSLSETSISYLTDKLSSNKSNLKWLDLESTNLNDTSARYLANMLMTNKTLTGLWLSRNRIGYHGVQSLAHVLINYNTSLIYLDLENNPDIDDSCFDCLMKMIECNQSLKVIDLNHCQLSWRCQSKLRTVAVLKTEFRLIM